MVLGTFVTSQVLGAMMPISLHLEKKPRITQFDKHKNSSFCAEELLAENLSFCTDGSAEGWCISQVLSGLSWIFFPPTYFLKTWLLDPNPQCCFLGLPFLFLSFVWPVLLLCLKDTNTDTHLHKCITALVINCKL